MITKGSILQSLYTPHCLAIAVTDQYVDKFSGATRHWVFDIMFLNGDYAGTKMASLTINWFPIA